MRLGRMMQQVLPGLYCILAAAGAQSADTGFYLSAAAGQSVAHFDDRPNDLIGSVFIVGTGSSLDVKAVSVDRNDIGFGGIVGYRASRFVALEAAYFDLGTSTYRPSFLAAVATLPNPPVLPILPPGSIIGGTAAFFIADPPQVETRTRGPMISALGLWPIAEKFDVYGRAGVYFADTARDFSFGPIQNEAAESTEELLWGVGAEWQATGRWSVRFDFERFENVGRRSETGEADIDLWSLGVLFRI